MVLDGWAGDPSRHNLVNGLRWGPDGWLYGRHGILANSLVGVPGTANEQRTRMNCGVWRYHPTRKVFEVVSRGTTNPWGMDWDEHGQLFYINTVIPHLWHAIPGSNYQRMYGEHFDPNLYALLGQTADHVHWDTNETWDFIRTGGVSNTTDQAGGGHAHSGLMIYQGDNWPSEYQGDVFAINFHGRRLNQDHIERSGATYTARHRPDPIKWPDPWFRGVEVISGADGGVYVADWSDTGECHDNDGVHRSSGRIYKITHGKPNKPAFADLNSMKNPSLVEALSHLNVWNFRQARRILQEREASGQDLSASLVELEAAFQNTTDVVHRLRYLWTRFCLNATNEQELISLLDDPEEHIRTWAVRLLVDHGSPSETTIAAFDQLAKTEESGLVLTYLASALQRLPVDRHWTIANAIAAHSEFNEDPVLPLMLWYGIEPSVSSAPAKAAELAGSHQFGPLSRFIARRLTVSMADHPDQVDPIVQLITKSDNSELQRVLLEGMADALRGLRCADAPSDWQALSVTLSKSPEEEIRQLNRELSVVFGDGRAIGELRTIATDPKASLSSRREAINSLVRSQADGLVDLLSSLLSERDLAKDAVRGISTINKPETTAILLGQFGRLPADARPEAIAALAGRVESARALLDAIEGGQIGRDEVSVFLVRQLRTLGDAEIEDRVSTIWPEYRPISESATARIASLRSSLSPDRLETANASQGRLLFSKTCTQCHILFGEGSKVGPELTGSQRGDLGYLLENLVDPNATLGADYRMTVFALADGRVINGIIAEQTDQLVSIQTPTERVVVPRDEIEEQRTSQLSLMPEGLLDSLDPAAVADLIRYLQSPSQVPLPPDSEAATSSP